MVTVIASTSASMNREALGTSWLGQVAQYLAPFAESLRTYQTRWTSPSKISKDVSNLNFDELMVIVGEIKQFSFYSNALFEFFY